MELIKITTDETGKRAVSAKDLYAFLEVKETFSDWAARMLGYGFTENVDYQAVTVFIPHQNGIGGTSKKDLVLTMDCAKEISMIQRTEKGKQARQYFLECERKANNPVAGLTKIDLAKMLIESEEQRISAEQKLEVATQEIAVYKPKALFADAVNASTTCIGVGELAKIIKQNGIDTGEKRLFIWMRSNGYMMRRSGMNIPTQYAMNLGLFEMKETPIVHNDGTTTLNLTPKITGKGQTYFITKFFEQRA